MWIEQKLHITQKPELGEQKRNVSRNENLFMCNILQNIELTEVTGW